MELDTGKKEELFDDCFDAVFTGMAMDEITRVFMKEFWNLAYMQGRIDGKEEQADKMLRMIDEAVN